MRAGRLITWCRGTEHLARALAAMACSIAMAGPAQGRLADPTRPPDYHGPTPQAERPWDLTSTLVSPRRRVAVINGKVVREGGRIGDMTVVRIRSGRVVLKGAAGREVVPLLGRSIKTPPGKGEE